jgi:hypothetical protein
MSNAEKLRDQLNELIDRLYGYSDDPKARSLIAETRELRREIIGYIKNPQRFDDQYLAAIKLELTSVVEKVRRYLNP